jgi:hypothetical protein
MLYVVPLLNYTHDENDVSDTGSRVEIYTRVFYTCSQHLSSIPGSTIGT